MKNYPESLFETGHTPPETIEQIKDVKRCLFNRETSFSVERRTNDKYGKSQWKKVEYKLEYDVYGKTLRAIICGLDIIVQKELEERYQEQIAYRNNVSKKSIFSVRFDLEDQKVLDYISNDTRLDEFVKEAEKEPDFMKELFVNALFDENNDITANELTIESLIQNYKLGGNQFQITYRGILINRYLNSMTLYLEICIVLTDMTDLVMMSAVFQNAISKDYDLVAVISTIDVCKI